MQRALHKNRLMIDEVPVLYAAATTEMEESHVSVSIDTDCFPTTAMPQTEEFWEVKHGSHTMFVFVMETDPLSVCYFESCSRNNSIRLKKMKFEVC